MPHRTPAVDLSQARRIAETSITLVFRRHGGARGRGTALLLMTLSYLMGGFFIGTNLRPGSDPFTVGVIASSVLMVFVLAFVATEFTLIILSPEDLTFYLPLPVSVWTFVSAKVAVLCLFSVAFAIAFAVPFLNIAAFRGVPLASIGGLLYSLVISSIIVTLLTTALLGGVLRIVPSRWIRGVAVYLQLAVLLVFYGGFALTQGVLRNALRSAVSLTPAALLVPSSWGPSILRLGSGGAPAVAGLCLSLLVPPLLLAACARILAPLLGGQLEKPVASTSRPKWRREGWLWRTQEERAIALLVRNHFRYNSQFRMAILVSLPITAIMVVSTVLTNKVRAFDPFTAQGRSSFPSTLLLYFAVFLFPGTVKSALTHSTEADASWIIYASPANRGLLLRAGRRVAELYFVVPYLIVLGALFLFLTGSPGHTIQHLAIVGALVLLEIDVLAILMPELPFSRQTTVGATGSQVVAQLLPAMVTLVVLFLVVWLAYGTPYLYWSTLAAFVGCGALARVLGPRCAAARLAEAEWE